MAYESATVLAPEVQVPPTPSETVPTSDTPHAIDRAQAAAIQNAVFDLDRSPTSKRLSWASILAITFAGFLITVALVVTLSWLLR